MSHDLPSGTVTFLFSDVEGSTALLHELGTGAYAHELSRHRKVVREAIASHGGVEVGTEGDSFFVAFPTAVGAGQAASDIQRALKGGLIRLRMGIHTGSRLIDDDDYVGVDGQPRQLDESSFAVCSSTQDLRGATPTRLTAPARSTVHRGTERCHAPSRA